jgi:hypothetical protein
VKSRHPHESIESERKFQSSNLKRGASHAYQVGRPGRSERKVYYTENQNEMNAKLEEGNHGQGIPISGARTQRCLWQCAGLWMAKD